MTLVLYMAVSIDGIAALDEERGIESYGSAEDRDFFIGESKKCGAVIMGRKTARHAIRGVKNIVLSRKADALAFCADKNAIVLSGSAEEICKKVEALGVQKAALLGGPETNAQFLKAGLVDEVFLTVEPVTIGRGVHFLNEPLELRWTLADTKILNGRGTIVLHYIKAWRP